MAQHNFKLSSASEMLRWKSTWRFGPRMRNQLLQQMISDGRKGMLEKFTSHFPFKATFQGTIPKCIQNVRYIFWEPPLNVKLVAERPPGVVFVGRVFKIPSKCKLTFSRPPPKHLEKRSLHFGYVPTLKRWWWYNTILKYSRNFVCIYCTYVYCILPVIHARWYIYIRTYTDTLMAIELVIRICNRASAQGCCVCVFFKCQGMLKPWTLLWLWLKTSNPRFSIATATWHKDVHAFQHPFSQMNQTTRQSWAFLEAPPGRMGAQPSSSPRGARQHLNAAATAATAATVLGAVKDMSLQIQILERLDIMNCKRKRLESSEFHRFCTSWHDLEKWEKIKEGAFEIM
jgi:hypothetical protein